MSLGFRSKVLSESGNNAISETQISNIFLGACPRTPLDGRALRLYGMYTPPPPNVHMLRTPLVESSGVCAIFVDDNRDFGVGFIIHPVVADNVDDANTIIM